MRIFLLSAVFLLLFECAANAQTDYRMLWKIYDGRNPAMDQTFKGFSASAAPLTIGIPSVVMGLGIIKKNPELKSKGAYLISSAIISGTITTGLKYGIHRDRPYVRHPEIKPLAHAGPLSFPSGHTASAFNLATSLSILFPKWYVIVPAYAWAGTVAYSRMHLGMHYPLDVGAGAVIGAGSAWLSWYINHRVLHWI